MLGTWGKFTGFDTFRGNRLLNLNTTVFGSITKLDQVLKDKYSSLRIHEKEDLD